MTAWKMIAINAARNPALRMAEGEGRTVKTEQQLLDGRRVRWFQRFLGRLGRRYWVARIDQVLAEAYHHEGRINGAQRDLLDARLKYNPNARKP